MSSSTPRKTRSRWSAGTGPPARPSSPFTAFSRSVRLIASPLTRATTSGSCTGTGLIAGGVACAAAVGGDPAGALCDAAGAAAGAAWGVALAAVLREQAASITTTKIEIARRTETPSKRHRVWLPRTTWKPHPVSAPEYELSGRRSNFVAVEVVLAAA